MKCRSGLCRSPVACESFDYCRELNEAKSFHDGKITLHAGDCLNVLKAMPENSVDAIVTDPPYHLTSIVKRFGAENAKPTVDGVYNRSTRGFMGKQWDGGDIAFKPELWAEVLRVLKPGGHMVCFGGTRTYHRMVCAIEDAGFEVRDQLAWVYGSGFPKSHDVSKGIDRAAGVERETIGIAGKSGSSRSCMAGNFTGGEYLATAPATDAARQWQGWGTALKPAWEPICLARKPLSESTVAANVLRWGTGALNIDGCRVEGRERTEYGLANAMRTRVNTFGEPSAAADFDASKGRWPANLCHDGSAEVLAGFPDAGGGFGKRGGNENSTSYGFQVGSMETVGFGDSGSAARFFYTSKADANDRLNSKHPTVKPVDLMQWLVRLVCPKGATVLDPFAGTGTTGAAAFIEGRRAVLIEREAEYLADIERRMELLLSGPDERARKLAKADPHESLPLFGAA
jgi:DNA modification methylase